MRPLSLLLFLNGIFSPVFTTYLLKCQVTVLSRLKTERDFCLYYCNEYLAEAGQRSHVLPSHHSFCFLTLSMPPFNKPQIVSFQSFQLLHVFVF